MEKKKPLKEKKTLLRYIVLSYVVFSIVVFAFLVATVILFIFLLRNRNSDVAIAMGILNITITSIGLIAIIFAGSNYYRIFYKSLYGVTFKNFELMKNRHNRLEHYKQKGIKEFDELNDALDTIVRQYTDVIIVNKHNDYTNIALEYLDQEHILVTSKSFIKEYQHFVSATQYFRNAFINFTYDYPTNTLPSSDVKRIVRAIKEEFTVSGLLIAVEDNKPSVLVYLPCFDSFSRLKEKITRLLRNITILKQTDVGYSVADIFTSVVVYPYSRIDEILSDLRYAARQRKSFFLYLPERNLQRKNDLIHQSTINLSVARRVVEGLLAIDINPSHPEHSFSAMKNELELLITYLKIDYCGIVSFDRIKEEYFSYIACETVKDSFIHENDNLSTNFIHEISEVADMDNSYFFSKRENASESLGKYLDLMGISSGLFYLIKQEGQIIGLVYFLNGGREMVLDNYLQETVVITAHFISNFLKDMNSILELQEIKRESKDMMMISNYLTYEVNRATYDITFVSEALNDIAGKVKTGQKCYKAIFGLEQPCSKCPIKTAKKMIGMIRNHNYEISMTLNERKAKTTKMFLKATEEAMAHERFDAELLVNSYYSFHDSLSFSYFSKGRGHLLLLCVNNIPELLEKYGPENVNLDLRAFAGAIRHHLGDASNIYLYKNNTFVIVLPNAGHVDALDKVEAIYEISKRNFLDDKNDPLALSISYFAMTYPQAYATPDDYIHHIDRFLEDHIKDMESDYVLFEEDKYLRPASKKLFMLSLIENAVEQRTFTVNMQPMVNSETKRIYGAELLIRLSDAYRHTMFNTFELIQVAANNNKIGNISEILIEFIGELYQRFGNTLFKTNGLSKLTMNTDYSYFTDPMFISKISDLCNKYNFPKYFLSFEITEKDVFEHFDVFSAIIHDLNKLNINVVCDQYTGQYVGVEKLKEIGFYGLKVALTLVKDIDKDKNKLNEVLSIIDLCYENNMRPGLVGVENQEHYDLIKRHGKECGMQGYHFFKPLETNELVEALKKNN